MMMKKMVALMCAGAMALSVAGCGGNSGGAAASSAAAAVSAAAETAKSGAAAMELTEAFAESPILLTSAGQSADYQMIGTVMGKIGMQYEVNNVATSADLGDAKTLVVVVGGSSKGLGAAGIDADGEIARLTELLEAAKSAGLSIIVMHTGGTARRGDLSDKFIAPVFPYANYAVIVAAGDEDGAMSGICKDKGIPFAEITSISEVTTALPAAFK